MAVNWSEQDLRKAQKALEKNTTVSAACAQLSKDLKRNVDLSNLRAVFRRNNLPDPKEFVSEGQQVEASVLSIDHEKRRLSLSMGGSDKASAEDVAAVPRAPQKLGTLGDLLQRKK